MKIKKNTLAGSDKYRLNRWLEKNTETITAMRLPEIAEAAMRDLGFVITANNIRGSLQDTGITLNNSRAKHDAALAARVEILERQLADISDRLSELESRHPNP